MDCTKKFIAFVFLLFLSSSAFSLNLPREDVAMQGAFCKEEWSKRGNLDVRMYNFCRKESVMDTKRLLLLLESILDKNGSKRQLI